MKHDTANPILSPELTVHKYAAEFPVMTASELNDLKIDIRANGQADPIILSDDMKTLIDGRNRLQACLELGVEPKWETFSDWKTRSNVTHEQPTHAITTLNSIRRQLNAQIRVVLAHKMAKALRQDAGIDARETLITFREDREKFADAGSPRIGGSSSSTGSRSDDDDDDDDESTSRARPDSKRTTNATAAAVHGVSVSTLNRMDRLEAQRPDLFAAVTDGKMTLNEAVETLTSDLAVAKKAEALETLCKRLAEAGETPQFIAAVRRGTLLSGVSDGDEYLNLDTEARNHVRTLLKKWPFSKAKRFAEMRVTVETTVQEMLGLCEYHGGRFVAKIEGHTLTIKIDEQ